MNQSPSSVRALPRSAAKNDGGLRQRLVNGRKYSGCNVSTYLRQPRADERINGQRDGSIGRTYADADRAVSYTI
jgi:hypothetical protein